MALPMIHKLGLTLVLLLACLGSAPLGSMEQAPAGVPEQPASYRTAPPEPVVGARVDSPRPERRQHIPHPTDSFFVPLPEASPGWLETGLRICRTPSGLIPRTLPPRLCERLPYDANAPPAVD